MGIYIYCIIFTPKSFSLQMEGISGEAIYLIKTDKVSAVVTNSPVKEYEISRKNLVHHQQVVEKVRKKYDAVLPVSFATVVEDARIVKTKLLFEQEEELLNQLDKVSGKVEFEVKAFWKDMPSVFSEISRTDEQLLEFNRQVYPQRVLTLNQTIEVGQRVERKLKEQREAITRDILKSLEDKLLNYKERPIYTEEIICNLRLLIAKEQENKVIKDLTKLKKYLETQNILLKQAGPMVTYDFIDLSLNI